MSNLKLSDQIHNHISNAPLTYERRDLWEHLAAQLEAEVTSLKKEQELLQRRNEALRELLEENGYPKDMLDRTLDALLTE